MLCTECGEELTPVDLLADIPEQRIQRHQAKLIGIRDRHGFHCNHCDDPVIGYDSWYAIDNDGKLIMIAQLQQYRVLEDGATWKIMIYWLPWTMEDAELERHISDLPPEQSEEEYADGYMEWRNFVTPSWLDKNRDI